jgi:hypothetical protein
MTAARRGILRFNDMPKQCRPFVLRVTGDSEISRRRGRVASKRPRDDSFDQVYDSGVGFQGTLTKSG